MKVPETCACAGAAKSKASAAARKIGDGMDLIQHSYAEGKEGRGLVDPFAARGCLVQLTKLNCTLQKRARAVKAWCANVVRHAGAPRFDAAGRTPRQESARRQERAFVLSGARRPCDISAMKRLAMAALLAACESPVHHLQSFAGLTPVSGSAALSPGCNRAGGGTLFVDSGGGP